MANGIEKEYLELTKKLEWQVFYQKIRVESSNNNYTSLESVKPANKALNRYRDVSPYDHSRIVLHKGNTDYINANLVKVEKAKRSYILTQGPLPSTVGHFWLMAWEQGSKAVLMLNKLVEKKQEKCFQYWPANKGSEHATKLDDVGLSLEYVDYHDHSYFLTRTLRLTDIETKESRDIIQFHYTTWPDFGVPSSPTAFLEFLRRVRQAGVLEKDVGPAIVHCSAGIGRSGTFCLVDSCLVLIEELGSNAVDVKEILLELRQYRMGLIQTHEQLRFSYQAIIEGMKRLTDKCNNKENNIDVDPIIDENEQQTDEVEEIEEAHSSEEEDPPPLPPPRMDSLNRNGPPIDRPLPTIPTSESMGEFPYDSDSDKELQTCPVGPLPTLPADEEDETSSIGEGELEIDLDRTESPMSDKSETPLTNNKCDPSSAVGGTAVRQRRRQERNEQLAAQVRDMKRRQQANEQWTQFKRPKTILPD